MNKQLTLAATLAALMLSSCKPATQNTIEEQEAAPRDITTSITATGTIEPVTSVEVGTQVSGIVSKLYVDYNSIVKAGQVIAELDKTNLISELESAQAMLSSAQSDYAYQKLNYERYKNLYDKGLISANDYDKAKLSYDQSKQTVSQRLESVKKAKTNLGYATITSPIDGIVLSKEVEEGQTVAASFNTPTLFQIAQDLTQMRVIADVDEADIGDVREGQRVSFTVDAFPNDTPTMISSSSPASPPTPPSTPLSSTTPSASPPEPFASPPTKPCSTTARPSMTQPTPRRPKSGSSKATPSSPSP